MPVELLHSDLVRDQQLGGALCFARDRDWGATGLFSLSPFPTHFSFGPLPIHVGAKSALFEYMHCFLAFCIRFTL